MDRAALLHDPLVTPDGVWAQPNAASLGKARSLLSAARVAVKNAMSRDATGDLAAQPCAGPRDHDHPQHVSNSARGSVAAFTTTQLNLASTDRLLPETLHGDAPISVGMLLLPRSATTGTADIVNDIAQQGDGGRLDQAGTIDASASCARNSPQSSRLETRPDDTPTIWKTL